MLDKESTWTQQEFSDYLGFQVLSAVSKRDVFAK